MFPSAARRVKEVIEEDSRMTTQKRRQSGGNPDRRLTTPKTAQGSWHLAHQNIKDRIQDPPFTTTIMVGLEYDP